MKSFRFTRWAIVLMGVLGNWSLVLAETVNAPINPPLPDAGTSVLRVLGALLLVLAIFFGGVWVFRNSSRVLKRGGSGSALNVLEVKSLGNRQALYVIGYGRQRMLIGTSPTGVALVSELPESTADESTVPPAQSFGEALRVVLNRKS
jgi:flagellar protein FliO/FliZ